MSRRVQNWQTRSRFLAALLVVGAGAWSVAKEWVSGIQWGEPALVETGQAGGPPSDAVVLFDGRNLDQWEGGDRWLVEDGIAIPRGGDIRTKESFGDCQLHLEWATPEKVSGAGQGRGNSGIFLGNQYEVQILDSFENKTYFDGQAGAIYKTRPPLVNASRRPGEWQTYDIVYTAPRFDAAGTILKPGYITVLHNGVLVQNHTELLGETAWDSPPVYKPHGPAPLRLQFHGNPVKFRNIWVRRFSEAVPIYPAD